jgi:hypothetical protein
VYSEGTNIGEHQCNAMYIIGMSAKWTHFHMWAQEQWRKSQTNRKMEKLRELVIKGPEGIRMLLSTEDPATLT